MMKYNTTLSSLILSLIPDFSSSDPPLRAFLSLTPSSFCPCICLYSYPPLSFLASYCFEIEGTYPEQCKGLCLILVTCHFCFNNVP